MDQEMLQAARQRLADYRKSVEEDIASLEQEMVGFDDEMRMDITADNHPADSADQFAERERHMALIQNLRSTMSLVEHASTRLEQGGYGTCENCQQAIDPERLQVLPYATLCITCQSRQEQDR